MLTNKTGGALKPALMPRGDVTDDGAVVYVENKGLRFGPLDLLQKLKRGEPVDPSLIYFRTVPKFETGHPKYRWLMEHLFIGSAARHAARVAIDVHQVL